MWAIDSLRAAIDQMARSGRSDIASDLGRILETVNLEEMETLRIPGSEGVADAIIEAETLSDLVDAMKDASSVFGADYSTFFLLQERSTDFSQTKAITTYPNDWVSVYLSEGLNKIDPVVENCRNVQRSFYWDEIPLDDPRSADFMRRAGNHGVGPSGYTCLMRTQKGDDYGFSLSSSEPFEEFRRKFERCETDCEEIARLMAITFSDIVANDRSAEFDLSDDHLRVLRALACGFDRNELEDMHSLTTPFEEIETSLKAVFKAKTLEQAAMIAVRADVISLAPIEKGEVFVASPRADPLKTRDDEALRRYVQGRLRQAEARACVLSSESKTPGAYQPLQDRPVDLHEPPGTWPR